MSDPYLAKDIAYYKEQDHEEARTIAVQRRAAEIMSDPDLMRTAVHDHVYDCKDSDTKELSLWTFICASVSGDTEDPETLRKALAIIATAQAEQEIPE